MTVQGGDLLPAPSMGIFTLDGLLRFSPVPAPAQDLRPLPTRAPPPAMLYSSLWSHFFPFSFKALYLLPLWPALGQLPPLGHPLSQP